MRAMVLRGVGDVGTSPLALRELADPEPGRGEVRVRVAVNAACRTDLHLVEGDLPGVDAGLVPGHQAVGVVDRLGEGVTALRLGERVGVSWVHRTCATCEYCRAQQENLCTAPTFTGWHVPGGYAELLVAPADWVHRLPSSFPDEEAAPLLCAGVIGFRALQLAGVRRGERLGLYGFGASAHVTIQVALHWGCEVFVATREEGHRRLALEMGATWAGEAAEPPPRELHGAILFAPAGELVPPALRALRRGGTLAVAGIHLSRIPPLDYDAELFHERVLRSVTANTRHDARALLAVAAQVPIRTRTTAYPLERANEALQDIKAGRVAGAAVLRVGG